MNQKEQRDELLSAYLDGELSAERQARLEAQLAASPVLQADLEALRRTVALVGDLPEVPVRRNFILPRAAMAVPRPAAPSILRRAWLAPILTAATSVLTLLFIVVLAGDLLLAGASRGTFAPVAIPAPEAALEIAPAAREVEVVVEEEAEAEEEALSQEPPPDAVGTELPIEVTVVVEKEGAVEAPAALESAAQVEDTRAPDPTPAPAAAEAVVAVTATAVARAVAEEGEEGMEQAPLGGGHAAPTATAATDTVLEEREDDLEPTPAEMAKAVAPVIEEDQAAAEVESIALMDEPIEAPRVFPWRVTELVLGLAVLTASGVTIWAWLARRR